MWSTRRLNDMDPCPWSATPLPPTRRDTRFRRRPTTFEIQSWAIPELGPPEAQLLIVSLGTT
jgi:hypothetical protein